MRPKLVTKRRPHALTQVLGFSAVCAVAFAAGCLKRPFNESGTRQNAELPKGDNYKNLEELRREWGGEWVWMPASKLPVYGVRRCPTAHGEVAEYHLRRKNAAARWDPLWAVACIRVGQGQAVVHSGEVNDRHDPSSEIIGTIRIAPKSFGWRVPSHFVVKPGSGGCDMEYSPEMGVQGINPSLYANLTQPDSYLGLEKVYLAGALPYQLLAGKECLTISGSASDNAPFFVYHSWRTENFGIVERIFVRGSRAHNRFELKANTPVVKTAAPALSPAASSAASPGAKATVAPTSVDLLEANQSSPKEWPLEGNPSDAEGEAIQVETASDDLAAIWTNPVFRSWVVRDLRPKNSDRHLASLLMYPIVVETSRYARVKSPEGAGSAEPNALRPPPASSAQPKAP